MEPMFVMGFLAGAFVMFLVLLGVLVAEAHREAAASEDTIPEWVKHYADLEARQTPTEDDIGAVIYPKRQSLYLTPQPSKGKGE